MVSLAKLWQAVRGQARSSGRPLPGRDRRRPHSRSPLPRGRSPDRRPARQGDGKDRRQGRNALGLPNPRGTPPLHEPFGERVSLAAINGPASLVLSGDPEALSEIQGACERDEVSGQADRRRLRRPLSPDRGPQGGAAEAAFAPISPRSAEIPLHSTVTGELIDTAEMGPAYWYRNLRQTVLLEPVLRTLLEQGKRALIEIGPHPVLGFGAQETIEDALEDPEEATLLFTLRREEDEAKRFALSLAQAHAEGIALDWDAYFKGTEAKRVPLPTYPFQRKRYWLSSTQGPTDAASIGQSAADHPLLGAAVELAGGEGEGLLLTGRISLATHPWLADHAVAAPSSFPARPSSSWP